MNEQRYMISDASKKLEVEPHVLRYWEEELKMDIPRNEMGHRCYSEVEIGILEQVKVLKEKGLQLRAIKLLMKELQKKGGADLKKIIDKKEEWNKRAEHEELKGETPQTRKQQVLERYDEITVVETTELLDGQEERMDQFQMVMNKIIANALIDNNTILGQVISEQIGERVLKEIDYQFRMREEIEEQRFKKLDETIRNRQQARMEAAAVLEKSKKQSKRKKRGLFSKKG